MGDEPDITDEQLAALVHFAGGGKIGDGVRVELEGKGLLKRVEMDTVTSGGRRVVEDAGKAPMEWDFE